MHQRKFIAIIFSILVIMIIVISCSSGGNSTSPGTETHNIKFTDYETKVKDITPDPFSPSVSTSAERAPLTIDPMWYEGDEAIPNKVLGENHPQSIPTKCGKLGWVARSCLLAHASLRGGKRGLSVCDCQLTIVTTV